MKQALIALAGTGVLALGLIAGSFAFYGGMPGVQAMSFMDGLPMLHNGHGAMHGGHAHHNMDCPYVDDMSGGMMPHGNHHQMTNGDSDCPFSDEMPANSMRMGMHHDNGHHDRQMMNVDRECPMMAKSANQ